MLDIKNSIRKEGYSTYIFKCKTCPREIKSKPYYLMKHSGQCASCVHKKEPFYHVFKRLKNVGKFDNHEFTLTYNDFLEFTEIKDCHYCLKNIPWNPYCYEDNEYTRGGYFLDRMDNNKGYIKNNCIVCCTKCNRAKGDRYNYEEWYGMTGYFRKQKCK